MATDNTQLPPNPKDQLPNVAHQAIAYQAMYPLWQKVRDCVAGTEVVKAKGEKYLPAPVTNDGDDPKKVKDRYNAYRTRALFYNATARTLRGMVGEVMRQDPVADLPEPLVELLPNLDGYGRSDIQLAKEALSYALQFGRGGLLVDFPNREVKAEDGTVSRATVTKADEASGEARPRMLIYPPDSIVNWRLRSYGALSLLCLVVIKEDNLEADDGFEEVFNEQYRVLRLTTDRRYSVEIWRQPNKGSSFQLAEGPYFPVADGKPFNEIPFTFFGSEDNGDKPNLPPLADLADVNLAHYRNSAEYEDSVAIVGQPTLFICGMTKEWAQDVLKGKVRFGSRSVVPLEAGSTVEMVQAEPNMIAKEAMTDKIDLMKSLGAQLVNEKTAQKTATEANQDGAAGTSVLGTCSCNTGDAMTRGFKWMAMFMGLDPNVGGKAEEGEETRTLTYELNKDFDISRMTPEEQGAIIASWQAEIIDFEEARFAFKRGKIAWKPDAEVKDNNEQAREDLMGVRLVGDKLAPDPGIGPDGKPLPPPLDPNKKPTTPPGKKPAPGAPKK